MLAAAWVGRRIYGTFARCSGSTTPLAHGPVRRGELDGYFIADPAARGSARSGPTNEPSTYGWEAVDPRFDATAAAYANEPHRCGYVVGIDPRKHTATRRFEHEGANVPRG